MRGNNNIMEGNFGQQPQRKITADQLETIKCSNCGGLIFYQGFLIKKVSALISPTGQEEIAQIPVPCCVKCDSFCEEFIPEEMRKKKQQKSSIIAT